ncbi:MAG TPA: thymidylate synthase, partial [Chitinophagaceae bacterium]|nr:thymidylate synthase [Chitinophagaceae bacterium]
NLASYALLLMMIAQVSGYEPGELIMSFGDVHIYKNHFEQVRLQLSREYRPLPTMILNKSITNIFEFTFKDFELSGYDPHPPIKANVAI